MCGIGRGGARGRQGGRIERRGGSHSTLGRDQCPEATVARVVNALVKSLSFPSGEGEVESVKGVKRNLEEMGEEKNEMKTKVSNLEGDLL